MGKALRIIFAGTPEFAQPSLAAIAESGHELLAVFTQPDRPAGRGRKQRASPIKIQAQALDVPFYQPVNLKDSATLETLRTLNPEVMVVVAYGLILPGEVLELPAFGCINVHASLLPRWRGAAPIQRAILAGDADTGISIMQMEAGLDTGPIYKTVRTPISEGDTARDLHDRLATLGARALLDTLTDLVAGKARPKAQDEAHATYADKLHKAEAQIDWLKPAVEIARQVRAFNPWPVAHSSCADKPLRIWQASAINTQATAPPGSVVSESENGIDVATAEGVLRITRLQAAGGKVLSASEFLNGHSLAGQTLQ